MPRRRPAAEPLRSRTGVAPSREVTFRFALDPTVAQARLLAAHAGAARFAFNHHIARIKANLDQRAAEKTYDVPHAMLTPALSWSKFSFINEFNAWKNGAAADSPIGDDGACGLGWRGEVSADVFECASVDAAQALANFTASRSGARAGKPVWFPRFKVRRKTTPAFRLRNRARPGGAQQIRVAGPKAVRLPTIGQIRVHGCTHKLRRMLDAGRCHLYAASVRFERGRWWIALVGVAAVFHHQRRTSTGRHQRPAGLDRGVKTLAVIADDHGDVLHIAEGVKALHHAQHALRRANKALARTKPGSSGRRKATRRLTRIHTRIANLRADTAHRLSHWAATSLTSITIEDLNVAGMTQLRTLARAVSDAGIGDLGRLLTYKTTWYGCDLHTADRWFPSSKTCSGCGQVKPDLTLSDRTYRCEHCGLSVDRDVNAAINLARWPGQQTSPPELVAA